ncbi:Y55_G0029050.mRNA.1.CDS.1, partial [Saccharomyces cerevisiae]
IIVGIPLLIKAIILGIQNILEVLLEDLGIHKRESVILYNSINIIIIVLYVNIH